MEAIKSLKSYWLRRAYQRLEDVPATKKIAVVRLGNGGEGRRRSRKLTVRVARQAVRLKKISVPKSPGKVMGRLRDAYMNAMLVVAGDGGGGAVWDRRIPRARQASLRSTGDFEKRVMIHLYNSVIATR